MKTEKLKECDVCVPPENVFKDAGVFFLLFFVFYVRKAQFKKAGPLPTLGFATSQEAFVEASFLPEGRRKISHTCQETRETGSRAQTLLSYFLDWIKRKHWKQIP